MITLTKPQRVALKAVFDRGPIPRPDVARDDYHYMYPDAVRLMSYKYFRKTVHPGSGCIMVPWKGMWLGIEPDGYTHS